MHVMLYMVIFFIELRPFRLCIEFSLENPKGGLHFVVPDLPGPAHENAAHVFTAGLNNCSRYFHALYSIYIHMTSLFQQKNSSTGTC